MVAAAIKRYLELLREEGKEHLDVLAYLRWSHAPIQREPCGRVRAGWREVGGEMFRLEEICVEFEDEDKDGNL